MDSIQMWAIGLGIRVAIAAFTRFCPKQKLMGAAYSACKKTGVAISKFLNVKVGKKAAESIEEGVIETLLATANSAINGIRDGLVSDNEVKK